jgi:hypothetical protein
MIKVFFISNPFLVEKSPNGQIMRFFLHGLSKQNFASSVLCSKKSDIDWCDPSIDIIKTKDSSFVRVIIAFIRRIFPDLSFLPDTEFFSWGINAIKISKRLFIHKRYDYLHSVSSPCACHLIAYNIKKKTGIPWIAQFCDPWSDNYFRRFVTSFFKMIDQKMEKHIADNADLIVHTNNAIADVWIKRYGSEIAKKIVVLPLSMPQQEPFKFKERDSNKPIIISHIGNLYKNRTSEVFIESVYEFLSKYPECRKKINIYYIGNVTDGEINLINKYELNDIFILCGRLKEEDCRMYYLKSDIFLAIDGVGPDNLFFPSKVMKYFFYRKPILGITPKNSVLYDELRTSGHKSVNINDKMSIVSYLYNAIENYDSLLAFDYNYWKKFSIENVVNSYKTVVDDLLSNEKISNNVNKVET